MGVVQKGPTLTLFFGPQKTSFFRLFSTFSGFLQKKRSRPTDATFDKNRSKNRISKKGKKTIKNQTTQKKRDRPKKSKKRPKNEKSIKTKSHLFEWDRKNRIQKMAISKRDKRPGKKRQKTWV